MDYNALAKKTPVELQTMLAEKRDELRGLRFSVAANQLKQVHKIRVVRTEIAHLMTRLSELKNQEA